MASIFRFDLPGDELHLKLGGGIPKKSFVLIEAGNGIGKSILAQRFSYGCIKNEHSVTYISSELSVTEFIGQMMSLNYDIRKDMLHKKFKYVTLFSSFNKLDIKDNLMNIILGSKELLESNIIVFDTLSEFLIREDMTLAESFELVSTLKAIAQENKSMVFCVDPDNINPKFLSVLRSVSDVYLRLFEKELYGNKIRMMKVERFNGAAGDVDIEIAFKVKSGVGILPELTS
ncbi:hypothetical protein H6503_02835 [Candidatus Woesearchaeota archaeon]|nr:hypothetical protein [Candidatus Woesearchaeota archaeon]